MCLSLNKRHLKNTKTTSSKVYFSPWNKFDENFDVFGIPNGDTYDWGDNELQAIYPRSHQLYTEIVKADGITGMVISTV